VAAAERCGAGDRRPAGCLAAPAPCFLLFFAVAWPLLAGDGAVLGDGVGSGLGTALLPYAAGL
jgi:hypothetical protein